MQLTFRAAAMAAAIVTNTLFGAGASGARAQDPVVSAATAVTTQSGAAWIAEGTVASPAPVAAPVPSEPAAPSIHADSLQELVGDMPIETELEPDLKCLAQAIYFEARGEPLDGQLAVAEVVINRATSGLYPSSYCDVIKQPAQFSFVRHGRIPQPDESSSSWRRAKAVAQIAQQDLWESKAADALYFHATYVRPSWARQKVQLAQIDTHIFYR
jgi:spore germination cell wall hydrolase CwlJ-like protein